MKVYVFRVRLNDVLDEHAAEHLHSGLSDEVGVEIGPRGSWVEFDVEARSFLDAVLDKLADVSALHFEPVAVEDELVSMADIAERTGRTRQSVSMLVSGQRGPANFPPPAAGNVRSPLWHWADVEAWLNTGGDAAEDRLSLITAINGALASRRLARERPVDIAKIRDAIRVRLPRVKAV